MSTEKLSGRQRIFVALDTPDLQQALDLVSALRGKVGGFKVGLELFGSQGPDVVRRIREQGESVFVDLKLHDIPNTVGRSAAALVELGATFFTLHAGGGPTMIARGVEGARQAALRGGHPEPVALAVTVLTSLTDDELHAIGWDATCEQTVERLAGLARDAGAGGLVCSPLEVRRVRELFPAGKLMVPGIRPATGTVRGDDQSRTATPARTVGEGADFLVIGRPITQADDPATAADALARQIDEAP